jgi:glycine/D-amino acid oxidase-like deaminating enzyme
MRICVIGGGIAGSLLAWRLAQHDVQVALVLGPRHHLDATAASGGVIRGYEPSAGRRELAIDSLLELAGDSRLRAWARYRQVSSVWAVRDLGTLCGAAAELGRVLPGSVELVSSDELAARGWAGLPELGGAICERQAGYLDPDALRAAVLTDLAGRANVSVHTQPKPHRADATILAAGAWTPGLLEAMGRPAAGFRTKTVQYSVHRTGGWRPTAFADATTGLYGRPVAEGVLLGLPTDDWDVDPNRTRLDRSLVSRAAKIATVRFPHLELGPSIRQVSAADCYTELALLALRPAGERVYTFTGGSGGAAKSVLAASTRAATALLQTPSLIGRLP